MERQDCHTRFCKWRPDGAGMQGPEGCRAHVYVSSKAVATMDIGVGWDGHPLQSMAMLMHVLSRMQSSYDVLRYL